MLVPGVLSKPHDVTRFPPPPLPPRHRGPYSEIIEIFLVSRRIHIYKVQGDNAHTHTHGNWFSYNFFQLVRILFLIVWWIFMERCFSFARFSIFRYWKILIFLFHPSPSLYKIARDYKICHEMKADNDFNDTFREPSSKRMVIRGALCKFETRTRFIMITRRLCTYTSNAARAALNFL